MPVMFESQSQFTQEQTEQPCHGKSPEPVVNDKLDCCDSEQNCGIQCDMAGCQSLLAATPSLTDYNLFSLPYLAPALALPQMAPQSLFRPPITA